MSWKNVGIWLVKVIAALWIGALIMFLFIFPDLPDDCYPVYLSFYWPWLAIFAVVTAFLPWRRIARLVLR